MPGNPWSVSDLIVLRGYFESYPIKYFSRFLPGRTEKAISVKANRMGLSSTRDRRWYKVNDYYFKTPNIENCYWAGFFAADGNIYHFSSPCSQDRIGLKLAILDYEHLKKFAKAIGVGIPVHVYNDTVATAIASSKMCTDLETNFSITPRKSMTLKPPNISDVDLVSSFIAGYFDGDGCVPESTSMCFLGTYEMLYWIRNSIAGSKSKSNICKSRNIYKWTISTNNAWDWIERVRNMDIPILNRKWEKIGKPKSGYERATSKNVRKKQISAWELRQNGLTYREIAEKIGYKSTMSVFYAIKSIKRYCEILGFDDISQCVCM